MNTTQNSTKSKIVKVIGVDLAKDHCDVIGYDENGKIGSSRKSVERGLDF